MKKIKIWWKQLPPRTKKQIAIVFSIILFFLLLIVLFSQNDDDAFKSTFNQYLQNIGVETSGSSSSSKK